MALGTGQVERRVFGRWNRHRTSRKAGARSVVARNGRELKRMRFGDDSNGRKESEDGSTLLIKSRKALAFEVPEDLT